AAELETPRRAAHEVEPAGVAVEREHRAVHPDALRDRSGLAARRRAGVERALARLWIEQADHELRGLVLHGEPAREEARQRGGIPSPAEHYPVARETTRLRVGERGAELFDQLAELAVVWICAHRERR